MKAKDSLIEKKRAVDLELERILSRENSLLFQAMGYSVLSGGKRFRPILLLSTGEYFGASRNLLLPFACSLELIHNYSLIHDDLPSMDNDDFRRGKPSCHKAFGEDIALLAGDSLLSLAFEILAWASFPRELSSQKEQAIQEISQAAGVGGMIEGQFLDITLSPEKLTEEMLHRLIRKKTGSLIIAAVKAGAILGQASPSHLEALEDYGRNIGFAFQVRDDILDSSRERGNQTIFRPNYVSFFGALEAERRLNKFILSAIKALETASLQSEELRMLALRLRDSTEGNENEQNTR
jgi:geranylgeranyl diphosphate synthase type II